MTAPRPQRRRPAARRALLTGVLVVAAVLAYPLLDVLSREDLLEGPAAQLTPLLALAALGMAELGRRARTPWRERTRTLRLVVVMILAALFCWVAGWSAALPAMATLIAIIHVEAVGSRGWKPAVATTIALTLVGEVGVHVGEIESVVGADASHLGSAWLLLTACAAIGYVGHNVGRRERSERALLGAEARLRALMESSTDVLTVADSDGRLTYVSPAAEWSMGYDQQQLLGTPLLDLVDAEQRDSVRERLDEVVRAGANGRTSMDVLVIHSRQERRWYEWTVRNLLDDEFVQGLVVDQRDVTERLLHQDALAHAASHDPLTGLPNRNELMRRISALLPQASAEAGVALLFLDLDKFKEVNDTYGHAAGDELLVAVARRLRAALRLHDHVARLGGDEFCALVTEVRDMDEVHTVVARLEHAVSEPISIGGGTVVRVGVSIGIALARDPHHDPAALFAAADGAMYRRKATRGARNGATTVSGDLPGPRGGQP